MLERVVAAVHAGGDIYARPRARLTAAVSGGGDIHYWGNPAVTMAVNGGGDVRRGELGQLGNLDSAVVELESDGEQRPEGVVAAGPRK